MCYKNLSLANACIVIKKALAGNTCYNNGIKKNTQQALKKMKSENACAVIKRQLIKKQNVLPLIGIS